MIKNNPYKPSPAKIISINKETDVDYTFRLELSSLDVAYGQFFQLSIPRIGEAPISVSDLGEGWIDFTIRGVGKLTNVIHEMKVGETIFYRGPYGNGFAPSLFRDKELIITAGGTGTAPVRSIINSILNGREHVKSLSLLLGFKNTESILFKNDLNKWEAAFNTHITLDSPCHGWEGKTGFVTDFVKDINIDDNENCCVIIVGPPMMIKYTALSYLKRDIPKKNIIVSMERLMSCGLGKCGHCKIDYKYICVDGPVFNFEEASNLID